MAAHSTERLRVNWQNALCRMRAETRPDGIAVVTVSGMLTLPTYASALPAAEAWLSEMRPAAAVLDVRACVPMFNATEMRTQARRALSREAYVLKIPLSMLVPHPAAQIAAEHCVIMAGFDVCRGWATELASALEWCRRQAAIQAYWAQVLPEPSRSAPSTGDKAAFGQ
jgi:hypothetical protein